MNYSLREVSLQAPGNRLVESGLANETRSRRTYRPQKMGVDHQSK